MLEESLMLCAISHQMETDYSKENDHRFPTDRRAFQTLHAMSKWIRGNVSGHNDFLGWFFDLESQLTELIASRREAEAYNAFIKTVSFLTECQDPYTAGHQKRVSELAEGIAREMGFS